MCSTLLQRPNSTLDYLIFLFYNRDLICRAKKQEIQSAQLIFSNFKPVIFFFIHKKYVMLTTAALVPFIYVAELYNTVI